MYRTAAWTTGGGQAKIPYDTKDFDSGTNVDVVTNSRFVAPVAGFYHFDATGGFVAAFTGDPIYLNIYKNGVNYIQGTVGSTINANTMTIGVSDTIQLVAGDYIEIFVQNQSGANKAGATGRSSYFSGFLVSTT